MQKILSKLNNSGFSAILILTVVVLVLFFTIVGNKLWTKLLPTIFNQPEITMVDDSEYEEEDEEDLDAVDELDGVTID